LAWVNRLTEKVSMNRSRTALFRGLAVLAALAAFLLPVAPGAASASTPGFVLPFVDCYVTTADGGYTFILGYTSTYSTTKTFSHGNDDHAWPSAHQSAVPTRFEPGTHHGVWAFTVSGSDLAKSARWQVDGYTLTFQPLLRLIPVCGKGTEMPMEGNGTGGAIALGIGGVVGAVLLRRATRREKADPVG
jgi:hypothetical protein